MGSLFFVDKITRILNETGEITLSNVTSPNQ